MFGEVLRFSQGMKCCRGKGDGLVFLMCVGPWHAATYLDCPTDTSLDDYLDSVWEDTKNTLTDALRKKLKYRETADEQD